MQYTLELDPRNEVETPRGDRREPLRIAGLFAGIGGLESGFARAGHTTTLFCENDPAAVAVLRARFPGIEIEPDIRTLADVGEVDLIAAGFPCQDLSPAGRTQGMNGVKSSLVEHVFRLLRQRPVDWVVLENVPFMLQLAKGEALKFVVTELEKLNYRWAYRVIDSLAFGLPQRRRRVFIVASRVEDPRRVLFTGNETPHLPVSHATDSACGFYWTEGNRGLGWAVDAVPTLKSGSAIGIASPPGVWLATGLIGKPDIRDGERLQGFPVDWTLPGDTGRVGVRWRLVGNAVTVDVAAWLGERLRALDGTLLEGVPLEREDRWPDVAWNVGAGRRTAALSSWPVCVRSIRLNEFLSYPLVPLSERATEGFYTRFTASSLKKPKGFVNALSAHLDSMRASKAHTEPKRNARSKR